MTGRCTFGDVLVRDVNAKRAGENEEMSCQDVLTLNCAMRIVSRLYGL